MNLKAKQKRILKNLYIEIHDVLEREYESAAGELSDLYSEQVFVPTEKLRHYVTGPFKNIDLDDIDVKILSVNFGEDNIEVNTSQAISNFVPDFVVDLVFDVELTSRSRGISSTKRFYGYEFEACFSMLD